MGVPFLEMDVRMLKDGTIIVAHDEDFSRIAQSNKKCIEVTKEELPLFKT